jgi:hypothetical protein
MKRKDSVAVDFKRLVWAKATAQQLPAYGEHWCMAGGANVFCETNAAI